MATLPRVGWIGAGRMGVPMAGFILKAGYPLSVFSRSAASRQKLVAQGAREMARQFEKSGITSPTMLIDRVLKPHQLDAADLERFMAKRMNANTIELDASHLSIVSKAKEVADLILQAAEA